MFFSFFTHTKKVVLEDGTKKTHYLFQIEMYLELNK